MPVSSDINKTLLNCLGWNSIAKISLSPSSGYDGYDAPVRVSLRFSFLSLFFQVIRFPTEFCLLLKIGCKNYIKQNSLLPDS
jgi:hypothetical protein